MTSESPLSRYLVPLRRWWPVVVVVMLVGSLIALAAPEGDPESAEDVEYSATYILIRDNPVPATEQLELVALLSSEGAIPQAVRDELAGQVDPDSIDDVVVEGDTKLGTLSIAAIQPTPTLAVTVATTYANAVRSHFDQFAAVNRQDELDAARERSETLLARVNEIGPELAARVPGSLDFRILDAEMDSLLSELADLRGLISDLAQEESRSTFLTLQTPTAEEAEPEGVPAAFTIPTTRSGRLIFALISTLVLGIALAVAIDRLDTRIRSRGEAEDAFALPVIAEIPRIAANQRASDPLPTHTAPGSVEAESYRSLRLAVMQSSRWRLQRDLPTANGTGSHFGSAAPASQRGAPSTILVTSPGAGDGKTTVAANLAATIAEAGQKVLVIDCDFRRPAIHEMFDADAAPSLHSLHVRSSAALAELAKETDVPGVSLIPGGQEHQAPSWFLGEASRFVSLARQVADVVIFDSGPLLGTNEAPALTPHVDAVLVVARHGGTRRENAEQATERLTRLQAMVAGIVLIGGMGGNVPYGYEPIHKTTSTPKVTSPAPSASSEK